MGWREHEKWDQTNYDLKVKANSFCPSRFHSTFVDQNSIEETSTRFKKTHYRGRGKDKIH